MCIDEQENGLQALLAQEVNRGRIPTAVKIGNQQIPHRGNLNADRIFIAFNLIRKK